MRTTVIVDDHPAIRLAVRSALESSGVFKVVGEADNGPAALSVIRAKLPALVILDLDLPKLSGLELMGRLRVSNPDIHVLVLSAQQESVFAARALLAGASGFLSKSEDLSAIVQAARSVLAGYSVFPKSALFAGPRPPSGAQAGFIDSLSDREVTVLQYLARGLSNKEVGEALQISNKTVSSCKSRLLEKLKISTMVELVDFARAHRLAL
ncbi:response regulator transcription factor [Variovorax sp. OV329]|uniref:response regulator transcription factor n=1 Tax=Variovorax sp. OV329 TaxID=1882825 RepID=UPI0008E68739|nr:response regulator transcription factor [Variovorax sp. OV329]SFM63975.1 two component transcriptional regulator, LuxR family [Variovorax sp. OV329]